MKINVDNIRRFHPDAEIHIGDTGLTGEQREQLGENIWDLTNRQSEQQKMTGKVILMNLVPLPALFMDGDAVLVRHFDLKPEGDIIVTVRESRYGRINSGVLLASTKRVVAKWLASTLEAMEETDSRMVDQDVLNEIAYDFDCKEVSCDQYNYPRIENGIPDDVRIVHLKSGRFKNQEHVDYVRNYGE